MKAADSEHESLCHQPLAALPQAAARRIPGHCSCCCSVTLLAHSESTSSITSGEDGAVGCSLDTWWRGGSMAGM